MKRTFTLAMLSLVFGTARQSSGADIRFESSNQLTPVATHSGCAVTVVDVNNDGLDDIVKMDQSETLVVELQQPDGSYTHYDLGSITGGPNAWGMAVADVDHNGWKDIATGTNGDVFLVKLSWTGSTIAASTTTLAESFFTQNITFGDFNGDGWTDLFVCDDVDYPKIYMNDGAGNLPILARSNDSRIIGMGPYTFTVQTGLSFTAGQDVFIGFNASNYMFGTITSYTTGTGQLTVNVTLAVGAGAYSGWSVHPNMIFNSEINPGLTVGGDPYDSGNYGSVWTDFDNDGDVDLYIAHCRQSASSSTDIRRRDRLFVNDGNNAFTEAAQSYGIEVTDFKQTWTTSFGDLDNDGDLDLVMTNHSSSNGQILQNDGTGHYTDITATTGFDTQVNGGMDPLESVVEDFDNDGYLDILVTGGGPGDSYVFYRNNGNGTFSYVNAPFPSQGNGLLSFATGDLNHDGKTDLIASYGDVYNSPSSVDDVVYLNATQTQNHFIGFNLTGTASNHDAIGTRLLIYGPWGIQVREVRSGESYGTSNSFQLHFGLGTATAIDSAVIHWPSGQQTHFAVLAADQFVTAVEGGCTLTGNIIPGPYTFCTGQTLTLTAAAGFSSYAWSTGATSPSIVLSASDTVSVTVTHANGCVSVSPAVYARLNPDETPTVTASSAEMNFCQGDTVILTASPSSSYLWSNGDTTQSIAATQSGIYSVTIQGACSPFTSAADTLNVFPAPAPSTTGAVIFAPGTAQVSATGNNIFWYNVPTGGIALDSGFTYTTPFLTSDSVFYAEDRYSYPGLTDSTGLFYHSGASAYSGNTTNAAQIFDVMKPCILHSVKVYTDSAGSRLIELRNSANTVLQSALVNIPLDTSIVTLDFYISPGSDYQLTTNTAQNMTSFGYASPRLRRNSTGVFYPYTLNGLLSITTSDQGSTRYYYFYDWVVEEAPTVCISERTPAVVDLITGLQPLDASASVKVYPNPVDGWLNFRFEKAQAHRTTLRITDVTGKLVFTEDRAGISGGEILKLDVAYLEAGTYMYTIEDEESTFTGRFTVLR